MSTQTIDSADDLPMRAYREFFYASPDYMTISRLSDGKYIDINPGFEKFTGYQRAEVIGKTATELNIWPDLAARDEFVAVLLLQRQVFGYPLRLRTRHGVIRDIEGSATITIINGERVMLGIVRDVTDRKRVEDELAKYRTHLEDIVQERTTDLRHLAQHDVLTGLPNRSLLMDRMAQAIHHADRNRTLVGVLFLDLDKFKPVNDLYGHHIGDALLRMVSTRLQQTVRKADTVARLGGDEFVVLLIDGNEIRDIEVAAYKIIQSLDATFIVNGNSMEMHASIGIAIYPNNGDDMDSILQAADEAMYLAKNEGAGHFKISVRK